MFRQDLLPLLHTPLDGDGPWLHQQPAPLPGQKQISVVGQVLRWICHTFQRSAIRSCRFCTSAPNECHSRDFLKVTPRTKVSEVTRHEEGVRIRGGGTGPEGGS